MKDRSWDEAVHTLRRPGQGEVFATLVNTGLNVLRLEKWFPARTYMSLRAKTCASRPMGAIARLCRRALWLCNRLAQLVAGVASQRAGQRNAGASIGFPPIFRRPPVLAWRRDTAVGTVLAMLKSVHSSAPVVRFAAAIDTPVSGDVQTLPA